VSRVSPKVTSVTSAYLKTNTLAHRVAYLIVNGADPRRILLMAFSRRAAAEMTKRVERISRKRWWDVAVSTRRFAMGRWRSANSSLRLIRQSFPMMVWLNITELLRAVRATDRGHSSAKEPGA
jgi:superfamily I DNA/RNA helicase